LKRGIFELLSFVPRIVVCFSCSNILNCAQWDVIMDWGLLTFTRDGRVLTRSRLLLPALTYFLVTLVNLALRFSWAINRVPGECVTACCVAAGVLALLVIQCSCVAQRSGGGLLPLLSPCSSLRCMFAVAHPPPV
jgi:hypothetical protein